MWAGMAMPWAYPCGLVEEHRAVRQRVGLCDASQLQVVRLRGPDAVGTLEQLLPRRVEDMAVGSSRFSLVLSRFGRIFDETLVMRVGAEEFLLSHGCGGTQRQLCKAGASFEVLDRCVLALQGPASEALLQALCGPLELPFLGHRPVLLAGSEVLLSRSGFTGELGFELFCEPSDAVGLWRTLLQEGEGLGLLPFGYHCVDRLRIEAGYTLYPNDLATVSLWEAGLGWLLRGKTEDFTGREAVLRQRSEARRVVVGVRMERELPRGTPVFREGQRVGELSSSAGLEEEALGLACIQREAFEEGLEVQIGDHAGRLARRPFIPRRTG